MHYPFWDTQAGYGVLMASIAVVHVFVSHFAIGGGLYLVIAEHLARRAADEEHLVYLKRLTRFFALTTLVFGALTGVGIWFVIGLISPTATEVLIHHFVWGWAIEWTFFVVEITAAILYYTRWDKISPRNHLILGWLYFAAAWLSLFVINGILTFMLTPGRWMETGSVIDGFFNPTMWPSLVFRTGVCIMLAGLYAMLIAARYPAGRFKAARVRYNACWGLTGLAVMVLSFRWYWTAIPDAIRETAQTALVTPMAALQAAGGFSLILAATFVLLGLLVPRRMHVATATLMMLVGLGLFSGFEMFRESIRKPFIITGYIYGNGLPVAMQPMIRQDGCLPHIAYRTGDDAADIFRHACRSCHTWSGYKPLQPAFEGTDRAFIASIVFHTDLLKATMPPFPGTKEEANLVAGHIHAMTDKRPFAETRGLRGPALGAKAWAVRCGICHEFGGYRDVTDALSGIRPDDDGQLHGMAGCVADGALRFSVDSVERQALIAYISARNEEQ